MMENIIITGIGSIVGWLGVQKWIFPYIIQFWNWLVDNGRKNIEITKDLREIEDRANNAYEEQITFLIGQVEHLEKQLLQYSEQLEKLRSTILELNQKLFHKSMTIAKLKQLSCTNKECPNRAFCTDDLIKYGDSDN